MVRSIRSRRRAARTRDRLDVELGGRGGVASPTRRPSGPCVRCAGRVGIPCQEQRHVVSGPSGTSVTGSSAASKTRARRSTACSSTARPVAGGNPGMSRRTSALVRARRPPVGELTHERPVGARRDGNLAGQELHDPQRVLRRLGHRLVPLDGRDPEHLHLGARQREHERDHVVVAGVAVDQNRDRHERAIIPRAHQHVEVEGAAHQSGAGWSVVVTRKDLGRLNSRSPNCGK